MVVQYVFVATSKHHALSLQMQIFIEWSSIFVKSFIVKYGNKNVYFDHKFGTLVFNFNNDFTANKQ